MSGSNLALAARQQATPLPEAIHGFGTGAAPARPGLTVLDLRADVAPAALEREWDAFVDAAPGGDLVQTAAWGRSKVAMGFSATLAVTRDALGRIDGGGLVLARRIGLAGGRLPLATVGYVARGPLMAGAEPAGPASLERFAGLVDAIEATARRLGIVHLVIQPAAGQDALVGCLEAAGYELGAPSVAPDCTLVLDLEPDLDTLLGGMSGSLRRNIRKAQRAGIVVRAGGYADLAAFQSLHAATAARQGFAPLSLDYLATQWTALRPAGAVALFLATSPDLPDRPIAGTWATAHAGTVTDRIQGWNGEAASLQPSVAAIWAAIAWAKDHGHRRFDLGGIDRAAGRALAKADDASPPDGDMGVVQFKARFGGSVVLLPQARHKTLNPVLRPASRLIWRQLGAHPRLRRFVNGLRNA